MKKLSFEQSYLRLKEINDLLQSDGILDVEKIIALQKEAKELYEQLDKLLKKAENVDDGPSKDDAYTI